MKHSIVKFNSAFALTLAFSLGLSFSPAHAVHQCGALKHGHDKDGNSKQIKQKDNGKLKGGCKQVRETDFLPGDARADAPELASRGSWTVGVRTLQIVNPDQIDILNRSMEDPYPVYDRKLTLEVWYPARPEQVKRELTTYHDVLGSGPGDENRPLRPFEFAGRAARGATPNLDGGPYPLVIVSHGFPGSRFLLTYLTENLASKGYVVVAIDHLESTHADAAGFHSTLLNRTLDINFVLDSMARQGAHDSGFLSGMVDADRTAVIGYSMGGYGTLNAAGGGYNAASPLWGFFGMNDLIARLTAGSPEYEALLDSRIRAIVAFAPWSAGGFEAFDSDGLARIEVPSLFISGKQDQTSGYPYIEAIFENSVNSDRYLLAYESAIHEVAVNPAPPLAELHYREYIHYQEPGWDNRRLNNINQHFITAFLGVHILGEFDRYQPYLDLVPISNDSNRDDESDPSYWKGFPNYSAIGMELHHLPPR